MLETSLAPVDRQVALEGVWPLFGTEDANNQYRVQIT
jgi:hypothetical protein